MNFELKTLSLAAAAAHATDLLLVLLADGFTPGPGALCALAARALDAGDLTTSAGKALALYAPEGVAARRVLLLGVGDASAPALSKALAAQAALLKEKNIRRVTLVFAHAATASAVGAAVRALSAASYVYSATKSKASAEPRALAKVVLGVPSAQDARAVRAAFDNALGVAQGVELAREWANRPANHATPALLAQAARALAKLPKVSCRVFGPSEVAKLGMGAFSAVARGSSQPLRFIELRYQGAAKGDAPVVLVGKGITFDSGGISLKPAPEMDEMKFDMGGAASVLGTLRALAVLQPRINVVGLIPACENLPDGNALKPGDVVTSMSGQTIEVLNTDAEGRLVLCDALAYAARFKPAAVIDIATLTGACVIALGSLRSGLFASDAALAQPLISAGDEACDPCWRMPLDDEYAEGLKSPFADVANVAGREAGAVTAAKFLQRFVPDAPWAHLDIAGAAWKRGAAKGGTGRPVGLLVHYLLARAQAPQRGAARRGAARRLKPRAGP